MIYVPWLPGFFYMICCVAKAVEFSRQTPKQYSTHQYWSWTLHWRAGQCHRKNQLCISWSTTGQGGMSICCFEHGAPCCSRPTTAEEKKRLAIRTFSRIMTSTVAAKHTLYTVQCRAAQDACTRIEQQKTGPPIVQIHIQKLYLQDQ